jgi:hypothetical protein
MPRTVARKVPPQEERLASVTGRRRATARSRELIERVRSSMSIPQSRTVVGAFLPTLANHALWQTRGDRDGATVGTR